MSGAPARGTVPHRQRRHHHHQHHHHHHHHHQKHQKRVRDETAPRDGTSDEPEEKRPKVNPIFLWASQREQRIVEVRCEDYDKRNRIKLTKTAQGWRSIPRTTCNVYTIAAACKRTAPSLVDSSPASSVSSNDEKENGKRHQEIAPASATTNPLRRKYATNGLLTGDGAGRKKRRYDEEENRRGYSYPLGTHKDSNWNSDGQDCSDEIVAGESEEDNGEAQKQRATKDRLSWKIRDKLSGRINLERLQKDKLFQPRVVLEQLHLSQLPESASGNVVRRENEAERTERSDERNEEVAVDEEPAENKDEEKEKEENGEKPAGCRVNKAGIQDILNMIDATASPVLATDTPSADLPTDSTKTYEILGEKQPLEKKIAEPNDASNRSRSGSVSVYRTEATDQDNEEISDKLKVYEEKILEENKLVLLSLKGNSDSTLESCKVAEADGGFVGRSRCRSASLVAFETPLETEEEAPDEPGELLKIDYKVDSSKILDALRNTPGLSISVASHAPEISKNPIAPARPPSKTSSSSRSPDSQAECAEKLLLKSSLNDYADKVSNRCTSSPRNLPGLSIVIPSYRYKSTLTTTTTISPGVKSNRVESPESTVIFNKADAYSGELNSLRDFPHEESEEEEEEEEDEEEEDDDCDSQVLEDLRRQKADSLAYDSADVDCYGRSGSRNNHEDHKTPSENAKSDPLWIASGRSSEAQAKCKHVDFEHLDLVLEELRSRGTVVSPQPSGIPCSPASRRPSSTYLERLLPSPPCSVSCSEDAKNELTLKSILASSCAESRDHERSKEGASTRSDQNVEAVSRPVHSSVERNARRMYQRSFQERVSVHSQEIRNSRPLSSGDIHSTYYTTAERAAPKRPMSAEWQLAACPRSQIHCYQKLVSRMRNHFVDQQRDHQYQVACATSSSTDSKPLDPANQLRELIETFGHLIPDPLLVPRDYLPGLAAAPATEIPKLLASRPELRLPEALTRPDLLRDPDLLVISLAHLQHVLDHGEGPVSRSQGQPQQYQIRHPVNKRSTDHTNSNGKKSDIIVGRPKLSCKPIGTLMATQPIDLSNGVRSRVSPCPPLLRVRSGLLKQEPEVSSTASSPDESQLWHPLFGSQKRQQQQQQQQQPPQPQQQQQHASWHRTTLAS